MTDVRSRIRNQRKGFGRVDFFVCLAILTLIGMIASSGIYRSKRVGLKLRCLGNMRAVGLGIHAYASNTDGTLPPFSSTIEFTNGTGEHGVMDTGWPIALLPALDAKSYLEQIKRFSVLVFSNLERPTMLVPQTMCPSIPILTCPLDLDSHEKRGGLSFVINAGFISPQLYHGDPQLLHHLGQLSWDDNATPDEDADVRISAATGVFWRHHDAFQPTFQSIGDGDGQTATLMVTENLQAGTWCEADTSKIGFGIPVVEKDGQVLFGKGSFFESASSPLNTEFTGGTLTLPPQEWRIDSDLKAQTGTRPRPSSNHGDGVNVIMCDGSGRVLSNQIDPHVYVKLLTPNGAKYDEQPIRTGSY